MTKLRERQIRFTHCISELIRFAESLSYSCVLGECSRSQLEQRWLIRDGQEKRLTSGHNLKLAADVDCYRDDKKDGKPKEVENFWRLSDSMARCKSGHYEFLVE